jgi:hypothetical protein
MTEAKIQSLVDHGLLRPKAEVEWKAAVGEDFPTEDMKEQVVFASYLERGFNLPAGGFFRGLLYYCKLKLCHTHFSEENRMHLICVPRSQFHTYDRLMSVISQDIAQNIKKRFINFYYTHEGRHEGLYTNSDNYEDATPSSSSTGF